MLRLRLLALYSKLHIGQHIQSIKYESHIPDAVTKLLEKYNISMSMYAEVVVYLATVLGCIVLG